MDNKIETVPIKKRSTGSTNQKKVTLGTNTRAKYKPKTQTGQAIVQDCILADEFEMKPTDLRQNNADLKFSITT
jgi:hypothetical protein